MANGASFLAMHKTTGQFYDVKGNEKMDFVCQYRYGTPHAPHWQPTPHPPRQPHHSMRV
jgi:hypothetical protein